MQIYFENILRLSVRRRTFGALLLLLGALFYLDRAAIPAHTQELPALSGGLWAAPSDQQAELVDKAPDPLWQRAVAIVGQNADWLPRRITEDQQVFASGGDLKERSRSVLRLNGARRSQLSIRVESATKNGADHRAQKQAELDASQETASEIGKGTEDSPFAPQNQSRVTHRALGVEHDRMQGGRRLRAFGFTHRSAEGVSDGTAWLDAKSGMPVRLESTVRVATLKPDPEAKQHAFELKSLRLAVRYAADNPRSWHAKSMSMDMQIRVRIAPLIYFEGRVLNQYRFLEHDRVRP